MHLLGATAVKALTESGEVRGNQEGALGGRGEGNWPGSGFDSGSRTADRQVDQVVCNKTASRSIFLSLLLTLERHYCPRLRECVSSLFYTAVRQLAETILSVRS